MKNETHNQHEYVEPSNLLCNLNDFFQQFGVGNCPDGAQKLKQIIDRFCYILGQSVNIFITEPNGNIIYSKDRSLLLEKLIDEGYLTDGLLNIKWENSGKRPQVIEEMVASEEIELSTRDGKAYFYRSYTSPIFKDDEEISHFIIIYQDITNVKEAEIKLKSMYYCDQLTQLPNRHCFEEDILLQLESHKDSQNKFAILFLDLDRFKFFNDSLGHTVGDDLIISISNKLVQLETDTIALYRFGGDEFTFIQKNITSDKQIHDFAAEIIDLFKKPFRVHENDLMITSSIGISTYPDSSTSFKKLIECADTAMHYAKERGKGTYQIFSENMNTSYSEKLKVEAQLRIALEKREFFLNYQPQIDLKSKTIIGVEALIRWINPELGFVPPNEFIPLAEDTGLIDQIGEWVLFTACQQIKKWQDEKGLFIRVGINISPKQFQRPDFVSKVERVLAETGLEAKYVDLEITENGLMQNRYDCLNTLERLKELGLKISIDDFGTGYSSLSYLKRFPIDTLKIDQSFVRDLMNDHNDQAIVTSIINLAHNMKLNVIAEGVETVEIVNFLNEHHCDEMQGFLYSKPLLSSEFEVFLTKLKQHETKLILK